MATAIEQQLHFFSPAGGLLDHGIPIDPRAKTPQRVDELAGKFTTVFSETQTELFRTGEPSLTIGATGQQTLFQHEVGLMLTRHLDGVISSEGKILNNNEWTNVQEIVPTIVQILLDRDDNHIKGVSRQQAINVIALAVDVARNPQLLGETVLLTAFGGSDDAHASMRLPAYPLSVLHIHQALQDFYNKRATEALITAQRVKLYKQALTEAGELDREGRRTLDLQLTVDLAEGKRKLPDVTSEERDTVLREKAIATKFPTIHLTYAHNAAIEVNTRSLPEDARRQRRTAIHSRTRGNLEILHSTVTAYPDVAPYVRYIEDIPWEKQSFMTRMHIAYMAHVLHGVEVDPTGDKGVKEALKRLRKAGKTHQGEDGYLEYAGAHPAIFLDAYNLPFAPTLQEVNQAPAAVITVGGEPEQDFHAVRHYLATHTDTYSFLSFLFDQRDQVSRNDRARLEKVIEEVVLWRDRGAYSPTQYTIHLSTSIGKYPVYYLRPDDKPYGSVSLNEHIRSLENDLAETEKQQPHDQTSALALLSRVSELTHLLVDLRAIQTAGSKQGRR